MSDFVSKLEALGKMLDSGKLTQEEFNRSKLSLIPGTPVESPASSFIPPSSVTARGTRKHVRITISRKTLRSVAVPLHAMVAMTIKFACRV
jgi:hypothetical protein